MFSQGASSAGAPPEPPISAACSTRAILRQVQQALHDRRRVRGAGFIHHSERGSQYLSVAYTERLKGAGVEPEELQSKSGGRQRRRQLRSDCAPNGSGAASTSSGGETRLVCSTKPSNGGGSCTSCWTSSLPERRRPCLAASRARSRPCASACATSPPPAAARAPACQRKGQARSVDRACRTPARRSPSAGICAPCCATILGGKTWPAWVSSQWTPT